MAGLSVSVQLSPSWRDTVGRFSRSPVPGSIGAGLQQLGRDGVRSLAQATPVRTGNMRAGWRSTYLPSSMQLRITNLMPYWAFVVWGTRYMSANPELQAVISQELPGILQTTADEIGRQIVVGLKGG